MTASNPKEYWNSRIGIILAVSGSAVGLGNFLRFPGLASKHGGGAFMLAYFVSFLIIGLSICWAEWAMGRAGAPSGARRTFDRSRRACPAPRLALSPSDSP